MPEAEGVIKYQLDFKQAGPVMQDLRELNVWRSILFGLGLIGQDDDRYQGYGFGNLSMRDPLLASRFIISGTQTGHLAQLLPEHYVQVEHCDIRRNRVVASGPVTPSSEALTHAMIYQLSASIQCVMHVHDPRLWQFALQGKLPATAENVEYGTQAMAEEVLRLQNSGLLSQYQCLVMRGHEDGLVFFGNSIEEAGAVLLDLWVASQA